MRLHLAGAAVDRAPRDPRHVRDNRAWGDRGSFHDTRNVGALGASIETRAELMEGFRICAKCGADDFTQRPCRRGENAAMAPPPPKP
jgi:hypothetical protein